MARLVQGHILHRTADQTLCHLLQVPGLCEDLLSSVDQPLKIARDKTIGKDYLLCDYNRDGDSYRFVIQSTELNIHLGFNFVACLLILEQSVQDVFENDWLMLSGHH